MDPQTRKRLTEVIERLGGHVGKALTRSAKGLIVLNDVSKGEAYAGRRVRSAADLGVPVFTSAEVMAWS